MSISPIFGPVGLIGRMERHAIIDGARRNAPARCQKRTSNGAGETHLRHGNCESFSNRCVGRRTLKGSTAQQFAQ